MFTGLIKEIGTLVALKRTQNSAKLSVKASESVAELGIGDSLAVNGICLTVTEIKSDIVIVDAVEETVQITTMNNWTVNKKVHLEPALKVGDPLGGHIVLGHVDGIGKVVSSEKTGNSTKFVFQAPNSVSKYLLPKGSIAIDGVSLTLNESLDGDTFSVNIIPHTMSETLFGSLAVGNFVNLEADVLAKRKGEVSAPNSTLTVDKILSHGFARKGRR